VGDRPMTNPSTPGTRLYAVAQRLFDAQTLSQVVEPTLADLQHELALLGDQPSARARVLMRGYSAFGKVVFLQLIAGRWSMDLRFVVRMGAVAAVALIGYVLALRVLPVALVGFSQAESHSAWTLYAAVQGLASLMPFAIFAAVLWGARGSAPHDGRRRWPAYALLIAAASVVAGSVSLAALPPLVPAVDHAPREATVSAMAMALIAVVRAAAGCATCALLAIALAPYARRVAAFASAVVLIPIFLLLANALTAIFASRSGLQSPGVMTLLTLMPSVLVFGVALMMVATRRQHDQGGIC